MSPKVHSIKKKRKESPLGRKPKRAVQAKVRAKEKKRKEKKRKKPVRLKTQKGGLGKSWGQRKEKKRILQDESLEV